MSRRAGSPTAAAKHLIDTQPADRCPDRILGDTAYGNGVVRSELAKRDVDVLAPVAEGAIVEDRVASFMIDPAAEVVTCPAGHTTMITTSKKGVRTARISRAACGGCPVEGAVLPGRPSRQIALGEREELMIAARQALNDPDTAKHLRHNRPRVERLLGLLAVRYGARKSRVHRHHKSHAPSQFRRCAGESEPNRPTSRYRDPVTPGKTAPSGPPEARAGPLAPISGREPPEPTRERTGTRPRQTSTPTRSHEIVSPSKSLLQGPSSPHRPAARASDQAIEMIDSGRLSKGHGKALPHRTRSRPPTSTRPPRCRRRLVSPASSKPRSCAAQSRARREQPAPRPRRSRGNARRHRGSAERWESVYRRALTGTDTSFCLTKPPGTVSSSCSTRSYALASVRVARSPSDRTGVVPSP